MQLDLTSIRNFLDFTLSEDLGLGGDITSKSLINLDRRIDFVINTRSNIKLSGMDIVKYFFLSHSDINFEILAYDGQDVQDKTTIVKGFGNALEILRLERTILNYLQHLSGVATLTATFVNKVLNTKAKISDTRKTIPGIRLLQKYAVLCGGGVNHRFTLDSSILIKDNHIAICGSIGNAIKKARNVMSHYMKIEVECDTILQVIEALEYGADIILLDNMTIEEIKKAINVINNQCIVEVSGGVDLNNVFDIAQAGVDFISVGKLTNSAKAVDIGLDI